MAVFAADTFNGGTGGNELGTAAASDGGSWTEHTSSTGAAAYLNHAYGFGVISSSTGNGYYYHSGTPASANYTVTADFYRVGVGGVDAGVMARLSTAALTSYYARYEPSVGWQLRKIVGGTFTNLGASAATLTAGTLYTLALACSGSSISLAVNGSTLVGPTTDTSITAAGKSGVAPRGSTSTTATYLLDNFSADDDSSPGSPTLAAPYLSSSASLFAPAITISSPTLAAPYLSSSATLFAPAITISSPTLAAPYLSSSATLFAPALSPTLAAPTIASSATLFAPAITNQVSIIDNGDAGFATVGTWTLTSGSGYGSDFLYNAAGTGADTATWTFTGLTAGTYRVSTTWTTHANRATNAPYTVYDGSTPLGTVTVNQENAPNDRNDAGVWWDDLGEFTITGSTLAVTLTDNANEFVIADAVRVELVASSPTLAAPTIASGATLYPPALTISSPTLAAPYLSSGAALFSPSLSTGSLTLAAPYLASGASLFSPSISPTLAAPTIASFAMLFTPILTITGGGGSGPTLLRANLSPGEWAAAELSPGEWAAAELSPGEWAAAEMGDEPSM